MKEDIEDAEIIEFTPNKIYQTKGSMILGHHVTLTKSFIRNLDKMISEGKLLIYDVYSNNNRPPIGKVIALDLKKKNKTNLLTVELYNDSNTYRNYELCHSSFNAPHWYIRRCPHSIIKPTI